MGGHRAAAAIAAITITTLAACSTPDGRTDARRACDAVGVGDAPAATGSSTTIDAATAQKASADFKTAADDAAKAASASTEWNQLSADMSAEYAFVKNLAAVLADGDADPTYSGWKWDPIAPVEVRTSVDALRQSAHAAYEDAFAQCRKARA